METRLLKGETRDDDDQTQVRHVHAHVPPAAVHIKHQKKGWCQVRFIVEVLWGSKAGNPCCTTRTVEAEKASQAWKMIADKVKKFVRFKKLHGGHARAAHTARGGE